MKWIGGSGMAGLFSSRGSDRQEFRSETGSKASRNSSTRTSNDLDNEISSLISEFGEAGFFASVGRVVESLVGRPVDTSEPNWDESVGWMNIREFVLADWRRRFPRVDVESELASAHSWLLANPRNRKKKYRRFLESWMSRAQKGSLAYNGGYTKAQDQSTGF